LIGIQPGSRFERVDAKKSFTYGNIKTVEFFEQLFGIFRKGPQEVGKNVGGPIAIVGATRQAVSAGPAQTAFLLATLSLSLGFFNLLPIPVLDGGHLALLTLEAVRRRKLTATQTQRVLATGLAIIAVLFVVITFKDIFRLFGGG
jgi:regulator of sigma E protease